MTKGPITHLSIDTHVRCQAVYPDAQVPQVPSDLKTVGIKLTREQALNLARVLLVATQEWDTVELVAHRLEPRRSDGTYLLTVLPRQPEEHLPDKLKHEAPKGIDVPPDLPDYLESIKDSPVSD